MGDAVKMKLPKYVTRDQGQGADGRERFYFRRPPAKKIRLHGIPYTPSFMAEYEAAKNGAVVKTGIKPQKTNTFTWLCDQYFLSGEFKKLDEKLTKPRRRSILLKIQAEPITPGSATLYGDIPLSAWNKKAIRILRDRKADQPGTASDWLKALRAVFAYAVEAEHCLTNPARDVKYLAPKNVGGHHSWTIEEVEQFEGEHLIGSTERLAMGILLYAAQRLSDVIRLGPGHVKHSDGTNWLVFTQRKGRNRKPIEMEIPIRPELQILLDSTPLGSTTFLVNEWNLPHKERGFSRFFQTACIAANVPGRSHGLRKAAAARLAELGASEKEIMAITGHTTSNEIKRYTEAASKRILAKAATARHAKKEAA